MAEGEGRIYRRECAESACEHEGKVSDVEDPEEEEDLVDVRVDCDRSAERIWAAENENVRAAAAERGCGSEWESAICRHGTGNSCEDLVRAVRATFAEDSGGSDRHSAASVDRTSVHRLAVVDHAEEIARRVADHDGAAAGLGEASGCAAVADPVEASVLEEMADGVDQEKNHVHVRGEAVVVDAYRALEEAHESLWEANGHAAGVLLVAETMSDAEEATPAADHVAASQRSDAHRHS